MELGQTLEVLQAGAGDSGKAESQLLESTQTLEVFQTGVGDSGAVNVQLSELSQPLQVLQTGVGDFGMGEVQLSELGQALEALQGCVVEYAPGEVDRNRNVTPQQLDLGNRLFLIWFHHSLRFFSCARFLSFQSTMSLKTSSDKLRSAAMPNSLRLRRLPTACQALRRAVPA